MISKIECAIREARNAEDIGHRGMKGTVREIAVENLFRPLLTRQFDLGKGKVVDKDGRESAETDVIIYSGDKLPPVLYSEISSFGLYPIESCIMAIEVKSTVNASEIVDTINKARQLRTLVSSSGIFDEFDNPIPHITSRVITALFAFDSDLVGSGKSELERYLEQDSHAEYDPLIHLICVVGKGCWAFKVVVSIDGSRQCSWAYLEPSADYNEVLGFLGRTVNSLAAIANSRGDPRFGNYIHDMPIVVAKEGFWRFINGHLDKIQPAGASE